MCVTSTIEKLCQTEGYFYKKLHEGPKQRLPEGGFSLSSDGGQQYSPEVHPAPEGSCCPACLAQPALWKRGTIQPSGGGEYFHIAVALFSSPR